MTQKADGGEPGAPAPYVKLRGGGYGGGDAAAIMHGTKLRYMLIFLTAVVIVTIHHVQKHLFRPRLETMVLYDSDIFTNARDPEVTCHYPILHPFEPSILPHVQVAEPIRCFTRTWPLTKMDDEGRLVFNTTALDEAGYDAQASSLDCVYQEVTRAPDDDFRFDYGEETRLTGSDVPASDFVYVKCKNFAKIVVYQNFHAYVRRHPSVHRFKNDKELGVAVVGLDSMSRLNFMRQLSGSYRYLTETMHGTVMLGFNKVGENTFPNVIPMLTGHPAPPSQYDSFKEWPFVWNLFAEAGAATMYSEDLPEFNMFDYLYTGIPRQPTLHYMRTFWLAVEDSMLYKMSSSFCLGPRPKHVIFFEYLRSFFKVYSDSPLFLFSLFNEASHDYVNTVGAIDNDYRSFLESCFTENLLNRTVTIVLGDHGNRIDRIRRTDVGRIEDMMPMVSVIVPAWVDRAYPAWRPTLRENSRRLTSTYDLHATFVHVLGTLEAARKTRKSVAESGMSEANKRHFAGAERGVSFFRPIPKTRDCDLAGVPDWFCVCRKHEEQLDVKDRRSVGAVQAVIGYFNDVLLGQHTALCAEQRLDAIERAVLIPKSEDNTRFKVLVRFKTDPGSGVFEATVDARTDEAGAPTYRMVGEVIRINRYGSQADCLPKALRVNSTILRGVCYCLN